MEMLRNRKFHRELIINPTQRYPGSDYFTHDEFQGARHPSEKAIISKKNTVVFEGTPKFNFLLTKVIENIRKNESECVMVFKTMFYLRGLERFLVS
jgi:hypothetical protein